MLTNDHTRLKWAESRVEFLPLNTSKLKLWIVKGFFIGLTAVCGFFPVFDWWKTTDPILQAVSAMVFFLFIGYVLIRATR